MKNINGQGSISYEKDRNVYRAAIVDTTGKRIRKRFDTRQEAEEWLTLIRASFYNNTYIPKTNYTLGDWIIEYLETYAKANLKESSIASYKDVLAHTESIAETNLAELNSITLQKFFNNEFATCQATGKYCYSVLNIILRKAVKLDIIPKNPLDNVEVKAPDKQEIEIFTKEEIHKILEFCKLSTVYKRYYPLVLLGIVTGARLGELLGLKWQFVFPTHIRVETSVRMVNNKIVESSPKNKTSKRNITIPAYVYDILQSIKHDSDYLFHTRYNNPYTSKGFTSQKWVNILKHAGVEYKKFHTLRHTHATMLLANGVPIAEVSKRLGHSNITTTLNTYAHFMPHADENIPEQIMQIYGLAPTLPPTSHNILPPHLQ